MSELTTLRDALQPFADYADPTNTMPASLRITVGSGLARRQLTMGDCYEARAALATPVSADPDALRTARNKEADKIVDLVHRFVAALLDSGVPRQRVEDYGSDIVRLTRALAALPPGAPSEGWDVGRQMGDLIMRGPQPEAPSEPETGEQTA